MKKLLFLLFLVVTQCSVFQKQDTTLKNQVIIMQQQRENNLILMEVVRREVRKDCPLILPNGKRLMVAATSEYECMHIREIINQLIQYWEQEQKEQYRKNI